jgi:hypothetical protein
MYMYVCGMIYMLPWWPYQYTCKTVIYYFIFQHDGIAELPVELFYNNSLVSGTFKQKSSPNNKTDRQDITAILLNVVLNTITLAKP